MGEKREGESRSTGKWERRGRGRVEAQGSGREGRERVEAQGNGREEGGGEEASQGSGRKEGGGKGERGGIYVQRPHGALRGQWSTTYCLFLSFLVTHFKTQELNSGRLSRATYQSSPATETDPQH